jgi:hypothetical protein
MRATHHPARYVRDRFLGFFFFFLYYFTSFACFKLRF